MLGFHIIFASHSRINGLGVIQVLDYLGPLALVSGGAKHSAIGRAQLSSLGACAKITGAHEKDHDHSRDILGPVECPKTDAACGPASCIYLLEKAESGHPPWSSLYHAKHHRRFPHLPEWGELSTAPFSPLSLPDLLVPVRWVLWYDRVLWYASFGRGSRLGWW